MATHGGDEVQVLQVGGFDILGTRVDFDITEKVALEKTTVFGQLWEQHAAVKPYMATIKTVGFYDDGVNSINAELAALSGTKRVLMITLAGNTLGAKFTGCAGAFDYTYSRILKVGALHKANGDIDVSGAVEEGVLLFPNGAIGTSPGADVDNTASTAFGASGYISVSSLVLGGFTSLTLAIQTSPDNITWTDKITFANVTAAPNAQRLFVAGTIDRHARLRWLFNGAGAGQSATVVCGLARLAATQSSV